MKKYVAIARTGDIAGMANKGEIITLPIEGKAELAQWRKFNRAGKIYQEAASYNVDSGYEAQALFDAAGDIYYAEHQKMYDIYPEEWSKWHARTGWVVKGVY